MRVGAMCAVVIGTAVLAPVLLGGCSKAVAIAKGQQPVVAGTLEGGPWLVEDLNGGGVIDDARVDLTFDPGDHGTGIISGRSGCNRYSGAWRQDGAKVTLGPVTSTMMACAPALMEMERKFLGALEAVRTVTYDGTGAAMLKAPDGRIIKFRRTTP